MAKLTRDLHVPFLDTTRGATPGTYSWVPIDLSTVFELAYNPVTNTYTYICYKNDYTQLDGYAPTMEQEIALYSDNPMYSFIHSLEKEMPVGSDAIVPLLLVEPDDTGAMTEGRLRKENQVALSSKNTVDGKIIFTLQINGDCENVKVTVTTDENGRKAVEIAAA